MADPIDEAIAAALSDTDSGGDSKPIFRTFNDGSQRRSTDGGVTWTIIDPAPREKTEPDRNLGAGVYEDARGFYVYDNPQRDSGLGVTTSGSKRYITEAEAKSLTNPQETGGGGSATAAGNLAARWAEFQRGIFESDRQYELTLAENAAAQRQAEAEMDFLREKEAFAQSQDNKRLANETQAQLFNQRSTIATLQQQRQTMELNRAIQQAQFQQAADQFNAQMGFSVAQANQQAQAQKRSELAQNARDIAEFSASPTDWGKLASFELAGSPFGTEDQRIQQEGGFTSERSLQPLSEGLSNRDRILAAPDNPYTFNPVTTPTLPGIGGSSDLAFLSGFAMQPGQEQTGTGGPLVNEGNTDWRLEGRPNYPDTDQRVGEFVGDRWIGPDVLAHLPKKEDGGVVQGAFIAGDSTDGKENEEVVIPDFPVQGMTTIVPKSKITPKMKAHLTKYATGGVFDPSELTGRFEFDPSELTDYLNQTENQGQRGNVALNNVLAARNAPVRPGAPRAAQISAEEYMRQAAQRARMGTPWETGALPGATFASSPGTDPAVAQLIASLRGLEYGEDPNYFLRRAARLTPASMNERAIGRSA